MESTLPARVLRGVVLLFPLVMAACGGGHRGEWSPPPPVVLTVGTPLSDTVFFSGFNAYSATVSPGSLYKISITNQVDDADLLVFGNDSTYTTIIQCAIDNTSLIGKSAEDCVMVATGNTLYFGVDGTFLSGNSATYTIDIELLTITNTALSTPYAGTTMQTGALVSAVTVSPGVTYTTSITGLTDNVDLYMFGNDNTFTAPAICSINNTRFTGTAPEDCTLSSSGGTLFFIVDGIFSSAVSIQFTALTSPTPIIPAPSDEGTIGSPVALAVNTPAPGQVAWGGTSFYTVSGLTAGTHYTVSITGLTENANLKVFGNDSTFTTPASCLINNTFLVGTSPQDCTFVASGGALYFTVAADTTSAGVAYINLIEPGP